MKNRWVIGGAVASASLLLLFFTLQQFNAGILQLETRWIALASLPVLIGLLVGGVIKRFSGFGIELEASLEAPINQIVVPAEAAAVELPADEKGSIRHLESIPEQRRLETRRLSFVLGRRHYYGSNAIARYVEALPNLEFIELRRSDGSFDALLPVSVFRRESGQMDQQLVQGFVAAVEDGDLETTFGSDLITEWVSADEEVVKVLTRVRQSRLGVLPVLDQNRRMIGVITTRRIEREITNAVLRVRGE